MITNIIFAWYNLCFKGIDIICQVSPGCWWSFFKFML